MLPWERWTGVQVGNKYSIDKVLSSEGTHACFLATPLQAPGERIVVAFFRTPGENDGWPEYLLPLSHPHLRRILGAGEESVDGRQWRYVAMERADLLLSERLATQGPLPTVVARRLAEQLIVALHYLHERKLVYRNLKPETVAHIAGSWKLADFRLLHPTGHANPRQTRSVLISSPQIPPDAFAGLISPAWDVYSLGVTLNQCLLGDETARGGRLKLPDPFERIVRECLDPNPESRISLHDIARMLGLELSGERPLNARGRVLPLNRGPIPILKPPPRPPQPPAQRNRAWMWPLLLVSRGYRTLGRIRSKL